MRRWKAGLITGVLAALIGLPAVRAGDRNTVTPATINLNTQTTIPLPAGFSGFNVPQLRNGVEYFDPKFITAVTPLKPGMMRFPAGTASMAFDWQSAHLYQPWINQLTVGPPVLVGSNVAGILTASQQLTQAKGGVLLSDFANFVHTMGNYPSVICFNSFTDNNTNSAYNMVTEAQTLGLNVQEWELSNEAYSYSKIYPSASAYASLMTPYYNNIIMGNPAATVGLFTAGIFNGAGAKYTVWDPALAAYQPRYWNASSVHYYPIASQVPPAETVEVLNGYLAYATVDYINNYVAPLVGSTTPIFLTEVNCCSTPNNNPFLTYLYNGLFLAEFVARMSTAPNVKAIGINSLYTDNYDSHGLIQSVNDFETYLINNVITNPSYSTNTATDPNTQFQFYMSAPGLAMQVANQAVNSGTAMWPTTVTGGRTVPIIGFGNAPIPAVYAQAYMGANGSHNLLIINKGNYSQQVVLQVNGVQLSGNVNLSYVSNTNPFIANSATAQSNVTIQTGTSANPFGVGPYSVTVASW